MTSVSSSSPDFADTPDDFLQKKHKEREKECF